MKFKVSWNKIGWAAAYLLVFAIIVFNFERAERDILQKGQLALSTTLDQKQVAELAKEAKNAPLQRRLEIVDLLSKHGWYRDPFQILDQDLASIDATTSAGRKSKQQILQRLGRLHGKIMRYKDAEVYLEQSLTQAEQDDLDARISVLNDLLEVDIQAARHATTREERARGEQMLNTTVNRLNKFAEQTKLDEAMKRMIRNHAQIALIELGRMLEVESYEHEPTSKLGL